MKVTFKILDPHIFDFQDLRDSPPDTQVKKEEREAARPRHHAVICSGARARTHELRLKITRYIDRNSQG